MTDQTTVRADSRPTFFGSTRAFGVAMAIMGVIGLIAAFVLSIEAQRLRADPNYVPSCTFNSVLSCTDVMQSEQGMAFGFPNTWIGFMGFPMVILLGLALASGVKFPRWMWWGMVVGLGAGIGFVHWLAFNAIYVIIALCPYCMVVWTIMMPLFVMTLVKTINDGARAKGNQPHILWWHGAIIVVVWYAAVLFLILDQFVF